MCVGTIFEKDGTTYVVREDGKNVVYEPIKTGGKC